MTITQEVMMSDLAVFWSYVHADDDAVGSRITNLAKLVGLEYELQTGESLEIFVDTVSLRWGDEWRKRIDGALAQTTFLIPIITPRFLQSEQCRREVIEFLRQAKSLDLLQLLLPILYVKPSAFDGDSGTDSVVDYLRDRQWIDWTELRLADERSEAHRRGVADLAGRLIGAIDQVEREMIVQRDEGPLASATYERSSTDDDAPGFFELLEPANSGLQTFTTHLGQVSEATRSIGERVAQYGPRLSGAAEPRATVALLARLASEMEPDIAQMEEASEHLAGDMLAVDPMVLAMVRLVDDGVMPWSDAVIGPLRSISALDDAADAAFAPLLSLANQVEGFSGLTKDLRRPFRRLAASLRRTADIRPTLANWKAKIDQLFAKYGDAEV